MIKHLTLLFFCFCSLFSFGNDSIYLARQAAYIDAELISNGENRLAIAAHQGVPIDSLALEELLEDLPTRFTQDFQIVELIRVLFFADSIYDDRILAVLDTTPFWINNDEIVRGYWSENHMIMWMSSEWLLHERYDRAIDTTLYPRLVHYLQLKKDYGFYEFFSSTYSPYTLSGLLNLYDFAEDSLVKDLAKDAAQRLLRDLLKPTTDLGVFYPAAGRNFPGKYLNPYEQNHHSLIYLLTGFGETPTSASHSGSFLATSTLPVEDVTNSWSATLDTTFSIGHSVEDGFAIHSNMTPLDRLIFQWSSTAYAHPSVVQGTFQLLSDSGIWDHKDWQLIEPLRTIPAESAPDIAELISIISYSAVISGHELKLFKNNGVGLMSISDLLKGQVGFQKWPIAATVGTTSVYTQSGEVKTNWNDRNPSVQNPHLPHVEQKSNVALVMYRPEPTPDIISVFAGDLFEDKTVSLFWEEDAYDQVVEDSLWLMGRQDDNYVAVRRTCLEKINDWCACQPDSGQAWVIMVGDASMYGSFSNFQNIISMAQFSESWYYDFATFQSVYEAQIIVDNITVNYSWGVDAEPTIAGPKDFVQPVFGIYPNPSETYVNLYFNQSKLGNIRVIDPVGKEIYQKDFQFNPTRSVNISTEDWQEGLYIIVLESEGKRYKQKLVKL